MTDTTTVADAALERITSQIASLKSNGWSSSSSHHLFNSLREFYETCENGTTASSNPANKFFHNPSWANEALLPPGSQFEEIGDDYIVPQLTKVIRSSNATLVKLQKIFVKEGFSSYLSKRLLEYPENTCNAAALLMIITNQFEFGPVQQTLLQDPSTLQMLIKCINATSQYIQFWCIGVIRYVAHPL